MMPPPMVCICFANEDRYSVAEPLVYQLRNYGLEVWYDRSELVLGDNRRKKNIDEGILACQYAVVVASSNTVHAEFALEEMAVVQRQAELSTMIPLPILYELPPEELPQQLEWIKEHLFKQVDRKTGLFGAAIHIVCRVTTDIASQGRYATVDDLVRRSPEPHGQLFNHLLVAYRSVDNRNLNTKVALLYALFQIVALSGGLQESPPTRMAEKIFRRFFAETKLNLPTDYRQIWILENCLCIAYSNYQDGREESRI